MVSVGLVTLVSHLVGLPSTRYGLPFTLNSKNFSSPVMPTSPAGLPGQMSMMMGSLAATGGCADNSAPALNHRGTETQRKIRAKKAACLPVLRQLLFAAIMVSSLHSSLWLCVSVVKDPLDGCMVTKQ